MARKAQIKRKVTTSNKNKAYDNVKCQIGRCGIYCGSCVVGNGTIRELAKLFEETYKAYGVNHWGPKDYDIDNFLNGLVSIASLPVCPGCLKGGGKDDCELRACVTKKGLEHCTECTLFMKCEHSKLLGHMHTGSLAARMFVLKKGDDPRLMLKKWRKDIKETWPCCILFMEL